MQSTLLTSAHIKTGFKLGNLMKLIDRQEMVLEAKAEKVNKNQYYQKGVSCYKDWLTLFLIVQMPLLK